MTEFNRFYSIREAAKLLGLGVSTLYAWQAKGMFPRGTRFGRVRRYSAEELQTWANELRKAQAAAGK